MQRSAHCSSPIGTWPSGALKTRSPRLWCTAWQWHGPSRRLHFSFWSWSWYPGKRDMIIHVQCTVRLTWTCLSTSFLVRNILIQSSVLGQPGRPPQVEHPLNLNTISSSVCKENNVYLCKMWHNRWHSHTLYGKKLINVTKPDETNFHIFQSHHWEAATGHRIAPWHPDWKNPTYF